MMVSSIDHRDFSGGSNEQVPGRTCVGQLEYQAEALPGCKSAREYRTE